MVLLQPAGEGTDTLGIALLSLWVILFASSFTWILRRYWKRKTQLKRYALRKGFSYLGLYLPNSFPITQAKVTSDGLISNAISGKVGSRDVLLFDCTIREFGNPRDTRVQTVVAIRGLKDGFGPLRFDPALVYESIGDWMLIYRPTRQMPVDEIDAILQEI